MDRRPPEKDLIVGLLLAAGRGSRFDPSGARSKLLAVVDDQGTTVAQAAGQHLCALLPRVVAVVRPAGSDQQRRLHALLRDAGCELVINPDADAGLGSSLAAGVRASLQADGWLIALADMPAIAPVTLAAVRDALCDGAMTAAPLHDGRRGHPVGFAAALRADLLSLSGDEGARRVLAAHPPRLVKVDDPGCLLDLDTPDDLAAARR
jgi:molybdenum cofactor cytidylyltransferase